MTHTSTDQPEALRLADKLESTADANVNVFSTRLALRKSAEELRRLHALVQELEAEKARLIETYVPCPSATEAYMYGISQEKHHGE